MNNFVVLNANELNKIDGGLIRLPIRIPTTPTLPTIPTFPRFPGLILLWLTEIKGVRKWASLPSFQLRKRIQLMVVFPRNRFGICLIGLRNT